MVCGFDSHLGYMKYIRNYKKCNKCNKLISLSNFKKHYNSCGIIKEKPKNKKDENWISPLKGRISPLKGRKFGPRSLETKNKISINNGGRLSGYKRKCKWYAIVHPNGNIIKLLGKWELRFSKVLNILDSNWIRPTPSNKKHLFEWIDFTNKKHIYIPDFYSPKLNKYYEIKGYMNSKDKEKMNYILSHYKNIEIIFLEDLINYEKYYNADVPGQKEGL
jgi:hypothetical protein